MAQLDLVLRGGRVIDPSQGIDSVTDVGFQDGRVAEIGTNSTAPKSTMSEVSSSPLALSTCTRTSIGAARRLGSTLAASLGAGAQRLSTRAARGQATIPGSGAHHTPLVSRASAAEELGLPMMVHIDHPPLTLEDVLARLRPGDILTHCFRPFPNNVATAQGGVRDAVIEARKRGVLFDIGHGMGSFAFKTARTMSENGFAPDCISSDVHALCIDGPAFDLITTMSKFLCLGMKLDDVARAATAAPAKAISRSDLGAQ